MSTRQLLDKNTNQIRENDKEIEKLVNVAKQGNKTAIYVGDTLQNQNIKLNTLSKDIEHTENKMKRIKNKFDVFLEKSSFCCLYIIITILTVCMILIILLL